MTFFYEFLHMDKPFLVDELRHQFSVDTGCSVEDLIGAISNCDQGRERERGWKLRDSILSEYVDDDDHVKDLFQLYGLPSLLFLFCYIIFFFFLVLVYIFLLFITLVFVVSLFVQQATFPLQVIIYFLRVFHISVGLSLEFE